MFVLDGDSEGSRWKAVMTNINEPVALRNFKKKTSVNVTVNDLPTDTRSDGNKSGRVTTEITRSA